MLKLKVCGLTDLENIKQLLELRPEMIGLIFYSTSQRNVSPKNASALCDIIPPEVKRVGVFVDSELPFITEIIEKCKLNFIQLYHQDISAFQELRSKVKLIKAISVNTAADLLSAEEYSDKADLLLFDAKGENAGGNGIKFDWRILEKYKGKTPFILSGGIDSDDANTIKKIDHERFYGIDINSKFEVAPGIKNIKTIQHFKTKLYESIEHNK